MSKAFFVSNECPVCGINVGSLGCTCDYPIYINALRACKEQNTTLREALEEIAQVGCSSVASNYMIRIAKQALQRAGGEK